MRQTGPTDLLRVAQAALDAELGRVAAARAAEVRLLQDVARLRAQRARLAAPELHEDPNAAIRFVAWSAWCDDRVAAHLREVAAYRATREALMDDVRRAFGRKRAIEMLIEKEAAEKRRLQGSV